jgi:hypothetical protein
MYALDETEMRDTPQVCLPIGIDRCERQTLEEKRDVLHAYHHLQEDES